MTFPLIVAWFGTMVSPVISLPYTTTVETPVVDENGAQVGVEKIKTKVKGGAGFYTNGLLNLGLSATWCF